MAAKKEQIRRRDDSGPRRETLDEESEVVRIDWDEAYQNHFLNNFYISWNPSVNKYREKLHLKINPEDFGDTHYVDLGVFNLYRKSQILLSLSPHDKRNECKFIFERHRRRSNPVKYEIRIKLFGFNQTRMRIATDCFKTIVVREDLHFDIISESMIFEELNNYDNYVLLVEMVPQAFLQILDRDYGYSNPKDPLMSVESQQKMRSGKLNFKEDLLMSISLYSSYETKLAAIPFRELVQKSLFEFSRVDDILVKLTILRETEIEIRVEGRPDKQYCIGISKPERKFGQKGDNSEPNQNIFLSKNLESNIRASILTVMLPPGDYFLHFFEIELVRKSVTSQSALSKSNVSVSSRKANTSLKYRIEILGFSEDLFESYPKSVEKLAVRPEKRSESRGAVHKSKCSGRVFFEADFLRKFDLPHSQTVSGSWDPRTNKGTTRFKSPILQNFHYNPGFVISLSSDSQVAFNVHPLDLQEEKCIYKVILFELEDNLGVVSISEPESYSNCSDYESEVFYLTKNKNGYLIVLVPKFERLNGDFQIVIQSDKPLANIKSNQSGICSFAWKKNLIGQVKNYQGGNPKTYSFFLNKNFTISISQRPNSQTEELFVEVFVENYSKKYIGLYLLPLAHKSELLEMTFEELNSAYFTNNFLPECNSLFVRLKPGKYMIIPTTFDTLKEIYALNYRFKIHCTSQFTCKPSPDFDLQQIIREEIREKREARFIMSVKQGPVSAMCIIKSLKHVSQMQMIDFILGGFFG